MKEFHENYPEWMQLLYDEVREEAYHELQQESKAFRYYAELSSEIQEKFRVASLLMEHAVMKSGCELSKEELQDISDLIACDHNMQDLITHKIYWKAWRDCIRSLRLAGVIPAWEESYETKIPFIFGK